jgi:hypothetical protein
VILRLNFPVHSETLVISLVEKKRGKVLRVIAGCQHVIFSNSITDFLFNINESYSVKRMTDAHLNLRHLDKQLNKLNIIFKLL